MPILSGILQTMGKLVCQFPALSFGACKNRKQFSPGFDGRSVPLTIMTTRPSGRSDIDSFYSHRNL